MIKSKMTNHYTKNSLPILAAIIWLLLIGCSGGGNAAGTYVLDVDLFVKDNEGIAERVERQADLKDRLKGVLELKADNTFELELYSGKSTPNRSGTWSLEGGKLTLQNGDTFTATLDGDMIVMDYKEPKRTPAHYVFRRQ